MLENSQKGSVPYITLPMLQNFLISIPSLTQQQQITALLNRFEAPCNDLTSGLPAEISARQKQYEYYRDRLLSFP
ncbi:MAG: restriction endonuclease subunit S, partial [Planctomycetia bacterium]|nr:restriction endonuclease subunit S [Planctomycetia bacterium]